MLDTIETISEQASEDLQLQMEYRNRLMLELELRNREETAAEIVPHKIQPMHEAFAMAYPLRQFIRESFPILVPGVEYFHNWHIDIIAELLQAITLGGVRNAIINIPRRCMKSLLVCVNWFCWEWSFMPFYPWLFTSYNKEFTKRDLAASAMLIKSHWFQSRWGDKVHLLTDRAEKVTNTKGGKRLCFRIGKGVGEGGFRVVADDPNDIEETESEKVLEKTNRGWNEVSFHNVTDKRNATRIIIQQRTNENDVTGNILNDPELSPLYRHLCLPMRFDSDHPHKQDKENPLRLGFVSKYEAAKNPRLKIGDEKLWIDPRDPDAPNFQNTWYQEWYEEFFRSQGHESKGEGQLLWEDYITEEVLKIDVAHLKAYGESAQLQQRPIRRGGNFFKSDNFPKVSLQSLSLEGLKFARYWDKAGTDGGGDWTVGVLLARTIKRPYRFWIIDVIRKQVGYYERMQLIKDTAKQDTADYVEQYEENEYTVVIEREPASSGKDLATIEKDELVGYDVFIDNVKKKKGVRAKPVRSFSEGGRIKVIKNTVWNEGFFRRLEKFDPNKENQVDDEIDGLGGAFRYLCFGPNRSGGSTGGNY